MNEEQIQILKDNPLKYQICEWKPMYDAKVQSYHLVQDMYIAFDTIEEAHLCLIELNKEYPNKSFTFLPTIT